MRGQGKVTRTFLLGLRQTKVICCSCTSSSHACFLTGAAGHVEQIRCAPLPEKTRVGDGCHLGCWDQSCGPVFPKRRCRLRTSMKHPLPVRFEFPIVVLLASGPPGDEQREYREVRRCGGFGRVDDLSALAWLSWRGAVKKHGTWNPSRFEK